jgi:YD repeat-containing protein
MRLDDAAGELTKDSSNATAHTYQWDAEGRVRSVDNGATWGFTYNALGHRVQWYGGWSDLSAVAVPADHDPSERPGSGAERTASVQGESSFILAERRDASQLLGWAAS